MFVREETYNANVIENNEDGMDGENFDIWREKRECFGDENDQLQAAPTKIGDDVSERKNNKTDDDTKHSEEHRKWNKWCNEDVCQW